MAQIPSSPRPGAPVSTNAPDPLPPDAQPANRSNEDQAPQITSYETREQVNLPRPPSTPENTTGTASQPALASLPVSGAGIAGLGANAKKSGGEMALYLALEERNPVKACEILRTNKIDPNLLIHDDTPLWTAVARRYRDVVELLLATEGTDPNMNNGYGGNPLETAAARGNKDIVKLLLETKGIDPNKADKKGNTPLTRAALGGYTDVVKLLLTAKGVDPDKEDDEGKTPLFHAAKSLSGNADKDSMIILDLCEKGASVHKVQSIPLQIKIADIIGHAYLDALTAPANFKLERKGRQLTPEETAKLAELEKDATSLFAKFCVMSKQNYASGIAAITLFSIEEFTLEIKDCPRLADILSMEGWRSWEYSNIRQNALANLEEWDGNGLDGAGLGRFSILKTEPSRLPTLSREILEQLRQ
ncbi:MAG: hypothetical protein JWQ23_49 [Herminiimonas sp.]|nr:hypothetical protein [Herminiimonas sp.]